MNPDLLNKLQESATKVLDFVEATGESTVDFAKEQVPLVVQDVLRWGMISNGVNASVYMFLLILMFVYIKKTASKNLGTTEKR